MRMEINEVEISVILGGKHEPKTFKVGVDGVEIINTEIGERNDTIIIFKKDCREEYYGTIRKITHRYKTI